MGAVTEGTQYQCEMCGVAVFEVPGKYGPPGYVVTYRRYGEGEVVSWCCSAQCLGDSVHRRRDEERRHKEEVAAESVWLNPYDRKPPEA